MKPPRKPAGQPPVQGRPTGSLFAPATPPPEGDSLAPLRPIPEGARAAIRGRIRPPSTPAPPATMAAGPREGCQDLTGPHGQVTNPHVIAVIRKGDKATDAARPITAEPILSVRVHDPVRDEFIWFIRTTREHAGG